jgi:ankyrin repeat protein
MNTELSAKIRKFDRHFPIHAIGRGMMETVELLLKQSGGDVNGRNSNGETPLYTASYGKSLEVVKWLIENGADVNKPARKGYIYSHGWTPLHQVADGGYLDVAKLLIENGADVNKLSDCHSPLLLASQKGNIEIVKLLLENGAEVDKSSKDGIIWTPLFAAVYENQISAAEVLIENGADVNKKVLDSARSGKSPIKDLEKAGTTPLYFAATYKKNQILDLLVENGADVNINCDGNSSLCMAIRTCNVHAVRLLLQHGANVNEKIFNRNLIFMAIRLKQIEIVELLILYGADLEFLPRIVTSESISNLLEIVRLEGWSPENHQKFSFCKQGKIETFFKLHSSSWISKIPKQLIYLVCRKMSLM